MTGNVKNRWKQVLLISAIGTLSSFVQAGDMINADFSSTNLLLNYRLSDEENNVGQGWYQSHAGCWTINAASNHIERVPEVSITSSRDIGQIYTNANQYSGVIKVSFDYDVSCADNDSSLLLAVVSYNDDIIDKNFGLSEFLNLQSDAAVDGDDSTLGTAVNEIFKAYVFNGDGGTSSGTFTTNITFTTTPTRIGISIGGDEARIDAGDHLYIDNVSLEEAYIPATTFIVK